MTCRNPACLAKNFIKKQAMYNISISALEAIKIALLKFSPPQFIIPIVSFFICGNLLTPLPF